MRIWVWERWIIMASRSIYLGQLGTKSSILFFKKSTNARRRSVYVNQVAHVRISKVVTDAIVRLHTEEAKIAKYAKVKDFPIMALRYFLTYLFTLGNSIKLFISSFKQIFSFFDFRHKTGLLLCRCDERGVSRRHREWKKDIAERLLLLQQWG